MNNDDNNLSHQQEIEFLKNYFKFQEKASLCKIPNPQAATEAFTSIFKILNKGDNKSV